MTTITADAIEAFASAIEAFDRLAAPFGAHSKHIAKLLGRAAEQLRGGEAAAASDTLAFAELYASKVLDTFRHLRDPRRAGVHFAGEIRLARELAGNLPAA